jgi:hypothetical protein
MFLSVILALFGAILGYFGRFLDMFNNYFWTTGYELYTQIVTATMDGPDLGGAADGPDGGEHERAVHERRLVLHGHRHGLGAELVDQTLDEGAYTRPLFGST